MFFAHWHKRCNWSCSKGLFPKGEPCVVPHRAIITRQMIFTESAGFLWLLERDHWPFAGIPYLLRYGLWPSLDLPFIAAEAVFVTSIKVVISSDALRLQWNVTTSMFSVLSSFTHPDCCTSLQGHREPLSYVSLLLIQTRWLHITGHHEFQV